MNYFGINLITGKIQSVVESQWQNNLNQMMHTAIMC